MTHFSSFQINISYGENLLKTSKSTGLAKPHLYVCVHIFQTFLSNRRDDKMS